MSASDVIEEIKHLPQAEQTRVLRFALDPARERQLSGEQLSGLAQRMTDSSNPVETQALREEIHRGFYGVQPCRRFVARVFRPGSWIICWIASLNAGFLRGNWGGRPTGGAANPKFHPDAGLRNFPA